jgi:putative cell wall-binding protein/beta-N-acetylglucosaminidase
LRKILFSLVFLLLLGIGVNSVNADTTINRLDGRDRFDVAVKISQAGWSTSSTVVLSFYNAYADALSAAPLAYKENAPILLTHKDYLTAVTKDEINRLKANKVIIVGGQGSVSSTVEDQLRAMGITNIQRFGGHDRFEVAKNIAGQFPSSSKAIIADGLNFSDALAIAPYAAQNQFPILLTRTHAMPAETISALSNPNITSTLVIGGEGSVGSSVYGQLKNPQRIGGQNRFEVAANIVKQLGYNTDKAYLATGFVFADALTGSVLAAKNNAPILLTSPSYAPNEIKSIIFEKQMFNLTILGGTGSVPQGIVDQLVSYRLATVNPNGTLNIHPQNYNNFHDVPLTEWNQAVVFGNKIVKVPSGMVVADPSYGNSTVNIYSGSQLYSWQRSTYVAKGTEMKLLEAHADKVKVQYADREGWVQQSEVSIVSSVTMNNNRSYYYSSNGDLVHVVKNVHTVIGKAPSFFVNGQRYYSWDGYTFFDIQGQHVGTEKQHFQYTSILTPTNYTRDQLLSFINWSPDLQTWEGKEGRISPLRDANVIDAMLKAQNDYGINALFILAAAIHESGYGVSDTAFNTRNLFGIRVYDSSPSSGAKYDKYEDSIVEFATQYMQKYSDPNDWRYNGEWAGNKGSGVNVWYASDPNWGSRVAGHMYKIDKFLGSHEIK